VGSRALFPPTCVKQGAEIKYLEIVLAARGRKKSITGEDAGDKIILYYNFKPISKYIFLIKLTLSTSDKALYSFGL